MNGAEYSFGTHCLKLYSGPIYLERYTVPGTPNIRDPDHDGALTVPVYHSEKTPKPDHEWQHRRITLACDTLEKGYEDIVLESNVAADL